MTTPRSTIPPLFVAVAVATLLAAWLRIHGITGQVLIDDEWHAIHKLMTSSYADIFSSFGFADHSIPLTMLYKLMAETVGLAEGRIRALQVVCGIALVPLCAWAAWRATRDAPASALLAFLVAAAPFLVMWSRFARPYSITLLLDVAAILALCGWRARRTWKLGAVVVLASAIATWFHPLSGLPPALACALVFLEDAFRPGGIRARTTWASLALGAVTALAMLALVAVPVWNDWQSLQAKAGGDHPDAETFDRAFSLFWGGLPTPLMWLGCAIAVFGAAAFHRRDARVARMLFAVALVPPVVITFLGAAWSNMGATFARYVLVSQPVLLFFAAYGAVCLARRAVPSRAALAGWSAAAALSIGYLAGTPAIAQVATLGPWYAHQDYHWDYRYRGNVAKRSEREYAPPMFYRKLAAMPAGSAPIIEAPFVFEAPFNPLDVYATYYDQPEKFGMLHSLCMPGATVGEPPARDRRFRFRMFVFLDDVDGVRNSGARYIVLHRQFPARPPFPQYAQCAERLAQLYGPPAFVDERTAVFELVPEKDGRRGAR